MAGTAAILARICLARGLFLIFSLRRRTLVDASLTSRMAVIAGSLGLRRRTKVIQSERLTCPIAFGLFAPTIGLPANFTVRFETAQQDAMLAHELAHLAAFDPAWHLLADFTSALLWWHPAVWWLRHQLQVAGELVADEASLLVSEGPRALATCLVALGGQLAHQSSLAGLRVDGFRSHLGHRVQRLLRLEERTLTKPRQWRATLVRGLGPLALAAVMILCSAWVAPQALTKGNSMNKIRQTWKRSLAAFALLAIVNHQMPAVAAAEPAADSTPATDSEATAPPSVAPPANRGAATDPLAQENMRELFMKRYGLRVSSNKAPRPASPASAEAAARGAQIEAKLKSITLPEIMFDGLPLGEVVRILSEQCRKRDPDGVNFLLNPNSPVIEAGFDPDTGLTLTAQPGEKIDLSSVVIRFALPLRNISMKDLLDAIVRVADVPIEYGLEDYGVVISFAPRRNLETIRGLQTSGAGGASTRLAVHTFKVDTNTFVAGLESAFGIKVDLPADSKGPGRSRQIQAALKDLLTQLGIAIEGNRSVFYNEMTGMVMVRVPPDDLETIAAAIQTLGGSVKN